AGAGTGRLDAVQDRLRNHHDAVSRKVGTPAEVDVVAEQRECRVEAAQLVPDIAPYQHPGRPDGQDVAAPVMLALVELAAVKPCLAAAPAADRHADLEQP